MKRIYSTLGLVSAWMGDRLWAGKLPGWVIAFGQVNYLDG